MENVVKLMIVKCEGMFIGPEGGTLEPCTCGGSSGLVVINKNKI